MEVAHTTGDRALDEEINRILARLKALEEGVSGLSKKKSAVATVVSQGSAEVEITLTVPADQSVDGSPVGAIGELDITDNTQVANTVKAGPSSGADAVPGYRSLVAGDLPNTAVTPGSYLNTNLTVDQQGRITAAADGSTSDHFPVWEEDSKTANYQPSVVDCIIWGDPTSAGFTITLGTLADDGIPGGKIYVLTNVGSANNVTVEGWNIGHGSTYSIATLAPGQSIITAHNEVLGHKIIADH